VEASHHTLFSIGFHYTFDDLSGLVGGTILKEGHCDTQVSRGKKRLDSGSYTLYYFKPDLSFLSGNSQHFGNGCDALSRLIPAIIPQQAHALLNSQTTDHSCIGPLDDDLTDVGSHG
jgi:hypothetical protein